MQTHAITADLIYEFAADVRAGLTQPKQKELPSKYLYDDVGSGLFEVISLLPEYGLTRADERLLRRHARDIVERLPTPVIVAELGSGSGKKTRWILEALCRRQQTYYCPRNFDRPAGTKFLREVRRILQPGDALLLGTDLEKPISQLIAAYDDPLGITAAFNLNLLSRINRELDGDFDLRQFEHEARFNAEARSVEMHIRSKRKQTVAIREAIVSVEFQEGETIWTESSHKYSRHDLLRMAMATGFHCQAQWIDDEWPFAENLFIAV